MASKATIKINKLIHVKFNEKFLFLETVSFNEIAYATAESISKSMKEVIVALEIDLSGDSIEHNFLCGHEILL